MVLLLTGTSDLVRVITGQAGAIDVHASFVDMSGATITPGRTNTLITTATTTTVVGSPAASTQRAVKILVIRNTEVSASVDITIVHTDGTTLVDLHGVTLRAGETLQFISGVGFFLIENRILPQTVQLPSDQSNSTTTLTEVTGLTLPCGVGTWLFEYILCTQSAATTTGQRFSVNHDGTVTSFTARVTWPGGTTASSDAVDQDLVAAGGILLTSFVARAKATTGWGTTLSVDTANADLQIEIVGRMSVSVAGNIELWHGSEVAAASTVKSGSILRLTKAG